MEAELEGKSEECLSSQKMSSDRDYVYSWNLSNLPASFQAKRKSIFFLFSSTFLSSLNPFPSVFRVHKVDLTKMSLPGPESGEKSLREKFRLQFDNFDFCDSPLQLSSHASRSLSSLLLSFLSLFESKYFNPTNLTFSLLDCQPQVP